MLRLIVAPVLGILLILNLLGVVVSGAWLAILGEWRAIGLGLLAIVVSQIAIGVTLMPSILLMFPAARMFENGHVKSMMALASLSSLYTDFIAFLWAGGVLVTFVSQATPQTVLPLLLWAYGVATSPWVWLAGKEQDNEFSMLTALFLQLGFFLSGILLIVGGNLGLSLFGLVVVMVLGWIISTIIMILSETSMETASIHPTGL